MIMIEVDRANYSQAKRNHDLIVSITSCQHPLDPGIGRLLSRNYYRGRESIHRASILLCESIFQTI